MKFIISLLLLTQASNVSAQNNVVVVPLGSDVSTKQFNDLSALVNQQRVYGGTVSALGIREGGGDYFSSDSVSAGVYQIRLIPPVPTFNYGKPSIVVTSIDLVRVANITSVDLELIDNQILYVDFTVELRTTSLFLSNSGFSFQLKFAEPLSAFSDQRLKTNIKAVGETTKGFKLYQFNYKQRNPQQTFVGIMAQDIIAQHPKAVSIDNNGYYKVNYTMLGLKMATLEDWLELGMESVELESKPYDG